MKTIETIWETWSYDVWGNEEEGFEVNDRFSLDKNYPMDLTVQVANKGTIREFKHATPTDKQIKEALNIRPGIKIETDGDDITIYVEYAKNGYPLGELTCVSHESLSPIRKK